MIEDNIYGVIDGAIGTATDHRIYATVAPKNTPAIPYVIYAITDSQPQRSLRGTGTLVKHTCTVEVFATTMTEANSLLASVRLAFDGYSGGNIHRAFWSDQQSQEEDEGHHAIASYTVWATTANIITAPGNNSSITTGNDEITLNACNHTLALNCSGLSLDGAPVGQTPDLTPYARKDEANTFAQDQTVNGKLKLSDNNSNRKGELSYFDAGGSYQFGRSDHTNKFGVTPNASDTRMSGNGAYLVSNGTATITGTEGGGHSTVDLNRRLSDNSTGVGGSVRCWTRTGQTQPAFEVLAPGGGSAVFAINASGQPVYASTATAPSNTTTPAAWVDVKVGSTTYKMPVYL